MGTALVAGKRQRQKFSAAIQTDAYQNMIKRTLQDPDREKRFVASITSAVAVNPQLQECTASSILAGALLGESLGLSPSPQLGQYCLVPFKNQLKDENGNKLWLTDENGNKLKDEVFKERLGEMPIKQLTRQAKDRCPGCMGFAEVMVMTYNGKKKTPGKRLQMSKLHQKDKVFFSGINEQVPDSPFEEFASEDETYIDGFDEAEDDEEEDGDDEEEDGDDEEEEEEEDAIDALPFAGEVFEL